MTTDYRDATERHWGDAEYLLGDNRIANADQLFGLSAECALKAVMQGLGMELKADGSPQEKSHRVHINHLWDVFRAFAQTRSGARYSAILDELMNPFADWDISHRYCHRSGIAQSMVVDHKQGAQTTKAVLETAILEAVVS